MGIRIPLLRFARRKGDGTVLASTNSAASLAEINDLLDAAVSNQLGRQAQAMAPCSAYTPVVPSMRSLIRSAWPLWRAYSSIMCT
jgi:hypothetical protein